MEGGELRKSSQSMPALKKAANQYTEEEFVTRLKKRTTVKSLDPSKPEPPFFCPDYGNYMDESEVSDLYAYLQSFAPKKSKCFGLHMPR